MSARFERFRRPSTYASGPKNQDFGLGFFHLMQILVMRWHKDCNHQGCPH